jgi:Na+-translocating ferredoxin:NAD+ oxidoreductase RnfC subunit
MSGNRCKHEHSCTVCGKCAEVCKCDPTDLYPSDVLEEMSAGVDLFEPFTIETPRETR